MSAWNKGKRVGQKKAFKLEDIWRIRIRLELEERLFELALFNLAIDSKLRSCDLRNLKVQDVSRSDCVMSRTIVKQQKTQQEVHLKSHQKLNKCCHNGSFKMHWHQQTSFSPVLAVKDSRFRTITTPHWLIVG